MSPKLVDKAENFNDFETKYHVDFKASFHVLDKFYTSSVSVFINSEFPKTAYVW